MGEGWLRNGEVYLYPFFIMLLPMQLHSAALAAIGFLTGLTIDTFYDTPGVHAGAATFSAFVRPVILKLIEPRAGYNIRVSPQRSQLGLAWFFRYTFLFLFIHSFAVQVLHVFTFYYFWDILLRTVLSWILSVLLILLADFVFNSRS